MLNNLSEKQLIEFIQNNDKSVCGWEYAYETLINKYMGLVKSIARQFIKEGVEFDDLVSLGCTGLIRAINEFDLSKDNKLSTYAYMWIYQSMQRGIYKDNDIVIPSRVCKLFNQILELKESGLDNKTIAKQLKISQKKLINALNAFKGVIRLESQYNNDGKPVSFGDTVADDKLTPAQLTTKQNINECIRDTLKQSLSEQEYQVIAMFYGLNDDKYKAKDIALALGLSLARIKQIVGQVRNKLARVNQLKQLWYQI